MHPKGRRPSAATTFIGREGELAKLRGLLATSRFVALTGPAGVGKSRLALELARAMEDDVAGGTWWCPLAGIVARAELLHTLCRAMGLDGDVTTGDELGRALEPRGPVLVVLDGGDELAPEAVTVVADVLRAAPDLRFLVTANGPGDLKAWEHFALEPLAVGGAEAPAVRLFLERASPAGGSRPELARETIVELVRRLDGLPLAIELVASLLDAMPLEELLSKTCVLLDVAPPGELRGKRSLRRALSLSWERLDEAAQKTLAAASVFCGGFDLAAAGAVVGTSASEQASVLLRLRVLQQHSLLRSESTDEGLRYALFDAVRNFAAAKLAESGEELTVLRRHAAHFAAIARRAAEEGELGHRVAWIRRLTPDEENLRAVVAAGLTGTVEPATALAATTGLVWLAHGRGPLAVTVGLCREVARACLPAVDDNHLRALFEFWASGLCRHAGDVERAVDFAYKCILHAEAAGDDALVARGLVERARLYQFMGDDDDACAATLDRAQALAAKSGDAAAGILVRFARLSQGQLPAGGESEAFYDELKALTERSHDPVMIARAWAQAALWHGANGRPEEALRALERVHAAGSALRHGSWMTLAQVLRGRVLQSAGRREEARDELEGARARSLRTGFRHSEGECELYLALLDIEEERFDAALPRFAIAERLLPRSAAERAFALAGRALAEAALGQESAARNRLGQATRRCAEPDHPMGVTVALLGAVLDVWLASDAARPAICQDALRRLAALDGHRSIDRNYAEELLRRSVMQRVPADRLLHVARGATWFHVPGEASRRTLEDSPVARALLWHLVQVRLDRPGEPISREALVRRIWPDDEGPLRAGVKRLGVLLQSLRAAGLRPLLLSREGGVLLDDGVTVCVNRDDDAPRTSGA